MGPTWICSAQSRKILESNVGLYLIVNSSDADMQYKLSYGNNK